MLSHRRTAVVPIYLFACLILGGSAQGIWQKMFLQLAGVAIIAWAALSKDDEALGPSSKQLLGLAIMTIAVVAVQMMPLPPSLWVHLGARRELSADFGTLGMPVPWEPISLTPADGLNSLLGIIPPLAIFCAMVRLRAYRPRWLAIALIAGTSAGIVLGALQVANARGGTSRWYLYEQTNVGQAVGFFANVDHMGNLLLATIPFLAAFVSIGSRASMQRYSAMVAAAIGIAIVILVGLALNGSLAAYGLALPVIAASALIVMPAKSRFHVWIVAVAVLMSVGATIALEVTAIGSGKIGADATSALQSRSELLATTSRATKDFMPFGSGLGSFQSVYQVYERPEQVTTEYAVHAHNDFVEVALELGFAGIILILLFLGWWSVAVWRAWRSPEGGAFARAASVASAAILVHSIVDFPLRTSAIAACFAVCLALLGDSRAAPANEKTELRRNRHIVI